VAALELQLLGAYDDVARTHGHRDAAAWYAVTTRSDPGTARAAQRTARALRSAPHVSEALGSGALSERHARAVLDSLDHLPQVPDAVREAAEARLVQHARHLPPRQVAARGKGILDEVDPHGHHRHLGTTLADEARRAWAATRLSFHDRQDGTTGIEGVVPTPVASRLRTVLHALTSPRSHGGKGGGKGAGDRSGLIGAEPGGELGGANPVENSGAAPTLDPGSTPAHAPDPVAYETLLGQALCTVLENLDPTGLPRHGGTATTVLVTIDRRALLDDLGTAQLVDADSTPLPASEARRLACGAGIVPAVLGSASTVLDLGRSTRLFTASQVTALRALHPRCQAEGCSIPAAWCEAHHTRPWSQGGTTDLANAMLLCSHHHHRVHDPAYRHEDGDGDGPGDGHGGGGGDCDCDGHRGGNGHGGGGGPGHTVRFRLRETPHDGNGPPGGGSAPRPRWVARHDRGGGDDRAPSEVRASTGSRGPGRGSG